jgi:hypothetical protein
VNWDTKFFRIEDTYWLEKSLISQALEKIKDEQHDILHTTKIFEGNFEAMYKVVFIIGISFTQVTEEDENPK